jgi:UDP-2,3-diacylglucosamine hydrolase
MHGGLAPPGPKEGDLPVAAYFASDVHLRLDAPDRGRRFARFVRALEPDNDTLTIVGDLCDFWYVARQHEGDPLVCAGLRALDEFRRRGGAVTILVGNHDIALGSFYATTLGLELRDEPLDLAVYGLRAHLIHGHRLEGGRGWKSWMESQGFLRAFHALPGPLASLLDRLLQWKNERTRPRDERRYFALFREYAARCRGAADLVIVGHVHTPLDAADADPRLIVLGSWHTQSSYLKIDDSGAALIVETVDALISHESPRAG